MEIIKDNMGRFVGTITTGQDKTYVRDFKTGNIVATYDANRDKTISWKDNKTYDGNQAMRFLS